MTIKTTARKASLIVTAVLFAALSMPHTSAQAFSPAAGVNGNFVHDAPGRLWLGIATPNGTQALFSNDTALKVILDTAWNTAHSSFNSTLEQQVKSQTGHDVRSVLSDASGSQLRLSPGRNGPLTIKYVVKTNHIYAGGGALDITYDLHLVLNLQVTTAPYGIVVADATAYALNAKTDSGNIWGSFAKAFGDAFGTLSDSIERGVNGRKLDLTAQVNGALQPYINGALARIPAGYSVVVTQIHPMDGGLYICLKIDPSQKCYGPKALTITNRPGAFDTSHDKCSKDVVWVLDREKAQRVPLHKGDSMLLETGWEVQWWCGDEDRLDVPQRAAGPTGTGRVIVTRAGSGRNIDWSFLP